MSVKTFVKNWQYSSNMYLVLLSCSVNTLLEGQTLSEGENND